VCVCVQRVRNSVCAACVCVCAGKCVCWKVCACVCVCACDCKCDAYDCLFMGMLRVWKKLCVMCSLPREAAPLRVCVHTPCCMRL